MSIKKVLIILSFCLISGLYAGCSDGSLLDISKGLYIYNIEDLKMINKYPHENFKVMKDIDAGGAVVSFVDPLYGTIDGGGHVIRNLTVQSGWSLFIGVMSGGEIKNLGFENISASSLVNTNYGTITNCYTAGNMTNSGFVYYNHGTISNCFSSAGVTGASSGGFAYSNTGKIENCYASGNVTGDNCAGFAWENTGGIKNCYSTGNVNSTGTNESAGFVMRNGGDIEQCRFTGTLTFSGSCGGGLVGVNYGTVYRCHSAASITSTGAGFTATVHTGGLVGRMARSAYYINTTDTIDQCHSSGTITINAAYANTCYKTGALVGGVEQYETNSNSSTIKDSYSTSVITRTGVIDENDYTGGMIGYCGIYLTVNISDCYSAASLTGITGTTNIGGLIGSIGDYSTVTLTDCFWDTTTTGQTGSVGSTTASGTTGLAAAGMQTPENFSGWDTTVWSITSGSYPSLINN